jgi:hypothetical protein
MSRGAGRRCHSAAPGECELPSVSGYFQIGQTRAFQFFRIDLASLQMRLKVSRQGTAPSISNVNVAVRGFIHD